MMSISQSSLNVPFALKTLKALMTCGFALCAARVFALPEAARYGQFSCTGCHISPGGGGVLTPHGRTFSEEKLSTWGEFQEGDPLHGLIPVSDHLILGGDIRWASLRRRTPDDTFQKSWRMQAEVEAGYRVDPVVFSLAYGSKPQGPYEESKWESQLRNFAGRVDLFDEHLIVRAGLFMPKFGLMLSDHTAYVRMAAGLDPEGEEVQAEAIFQSDHFEVTVALLTGSRIPGRKEEDSYGKSGFNLGLSYYRARQRFNVNLLNATSKADDDDDKPEITSTSMSVSTVLTLHRLVFAMLEANQVTTTTKIALNSDKKMSRATFASLNMEVVKGLIPYLRYEFWDFDTAEKNTSRQRWGLGSNWYIRPHLQMEARWLRSIVNQSRTATDELNGILHYYF